MIEYKNGIHLKGTELWFDSKRKVPLSFISSANIEKFTPPEKILATPETIKFLEKKINKPVVLACPYHRPFALGSLEVELVPSGTMLGSSQLIVDKGEKTLLYSGDINLKNLPTSEPAYTKHCDVLVMKCRYGLREYQFPSFDRSIKNVVEFVDHAMCSNSTPILVVEPLGKAQDIIKALGEDGYKLSLGKSIYKYMGVYENLGIEFGDYSRYKASKVKGTIVMISPNETGSDDITDIKKKKVAVIAESTEVEKLAIKSKYNADSVITLCNHADFKDLLEFVGLVDPEKIYLVEENANQFAQVLKDMGHDAVSLEKPTQLNLL